MVGNVQKWSEMGSYTRYVVVGHGLRWYDVVRSGGQWSRVVGSGQK